MSSRETEVTVEPLELQGRGKTKKKGRDKNPLERKIRSDHGYPYVTLPKFFLELGLSLNQEVIIEKRDSSNPLKWEIVIKPKVQRKRSK